MPNKIQAEHGASIAMTITLASLATSTVGVGRQSTMIDNTDNAQMVRVYYKVTTGTSPTVNKSIQFYLLCGDDPSSSNIRTDNAGASDAALTVVTATLVNVVQTTATSDVTYRGSFLIRNPGIEWGIAIVHDTGVNLNATAGNHSIRYVTEDQEVQ
jgi:hypothetical protein